MLEGDCERAAVSSAERLDKAGLGVHFHDPGRAVGAAVAETLGGRGDVAWDTYLFYPPGIRWDGTPPAPQDWYHQLGGAAWAGVSRYRTGRGLARALRRGAVRFAGMDPLP